MKNNIVSVVSADHKSQKNEKRGRETGKTPIMPCEHNARTFSKMADGPNEFQLDQPPSDGISSVKFSPTSASFLVVSSWDTVSVFYLNFEGKLF